MQGDVLTDVTVVSPARIQAICKIEAIVTTHELYPLLCQVPGKKKSS